MRRASYLLSAGLSTVIVLIAGAVMAGTMPPEMRNEQPTVALAVAPAYPVLAVASNTSGTVRIEVQVSLTGEVTSARAADGHQLLRGMAESTARRA